MEANCYAYLRRCHKCKVYANLQHQPPSFISTLTFPWPFSIWGIDIIGKIAPKGTDRHKYVLIAIDNFTMWVEATSYAKITTKHVAKFLLDTLYVDMACYMN